MDPYNHSTPTSTKLPILDTGKFEQWKFRIQQYLQHEHYALWEVIEFGDSYKAPPEETGKGVTGEGSAKKKGRTVAITVEDMQKRRNDVKARTTLLLALPDEHQLRFSKYDNAKELWEAILKTFGGNEATKKTKKNQLKQQYGNFKAEGSETLEQTFNRLQAIVSHLEFMDVPIEQDDLNQKFLSSLAPEWLKLLIKKYYPRIEVQKMEDKFYHLDVKGNDLKAYVRRFQELATFCPTMVPDSEKMMEVFIGGLPRSIKGNVTSSKPQILEETINIAQRLMDQDHKISQVYDNATDADII
ncbi:ribonuclease H-like domain-containing protein [Tanacetum coccineum]